MSSLVSVPSAGHQQPRVSHIPEYVSSTGEEAIELCEMVGLYLDEWQQLVLTHALGEREDGNWAAFEVGLTVPRQNGKGSILEARELAGLFLLGEELITHTAHEFKTSKEAMRRLEALIRNTSEFDRRVKRYSHSHGDETIELKNGQRVMFATRTKGAGRGFSGECLIYDEDMLLQESAIGATMPTLSARKNPQLWYTGSAVDQEVHEHGVVKSRLRQRGLEGKDPELLYMEWSVDAENPDEVEAATDRELWAQANPALDIRIAPDHIAREQRSMDPRTFAVERLNVGDWPDPEGDSPLIPTWEELADTETDRAGRYVSRIDRALRLGFDVSPSRSSAAICAAGRRPDDLFHVEVIDHGSGTGWVVDRVVELSEKHGVPVSLDERGPAASLMQALADRGVELEPLNSGAYAQACGFFFDACGVEGDDPEVLKRASLRHLGTTELSRAVRGVAQRPLGDAWAWSRKQSSVDITPLVACTAALWRASKVEPKHGRAQW